MDTAISIQNLSKRFGGTVAVNDVTLDLEPDGMFGLIGPNGSGKSTLFNLVVGAHRPTAGLVRIHGQTVSGLPTHRVAKIGAVRTFQARTLFDNRTVRGNVALAKAFSKSDESVEDVLRLSGLEKCADDLARAIPTEGARRLAIAMAAMVRPRVLLLDEPAAGLAPGELIRLSEFLVELKSRLNATVWVVDHDMGFLLGLVERVIVMDDGSVIADGTPTEIRRSPRVRSVYLGPE